MNLTELKNLINKKESDTLEFKSSLTQLKAAFQTVCAFLNSGGGTVLIGVKDNGDINGQTVSDKTQLEISNHIAKIEPPILLPVDPIKVNDEMSVIRISVIPIPEDMPYVFDGKPYSRVLSTTKQMSQQIYQQLLSERKTNNVSWDAKTANEITFNHLDGDEIIKSLKDSISRGWTESKLASDEPKEALLRLKLLKNNQIINAAAVLFSKDPESYFPQCLLRLARFKGESKNTIIDSKRIYANAFTQPEESEKFLMRNMSIASDFIPGKMARVDHPEYPLRAIREAMVNAICHRDYSMPGGSISFMMYDDKLEITSHGTLPKGITVNELKTVHESFPRNKKIAHPLYKRGIIESVGTGTQEIIEECAQMGLREPEYIERGTTFVVRFYPNPKIKKHAKDIDDNELSKRHKEIIAVMESLDECSTSEIMGAMVAPPTDRTLRSDLNRLEAFGYIKRRGEGSGTRWMLVI